MIKTGTQAYLGKDIEYISIDLSKKKNKGVLNIIEGQEVLSDKYKYEIQAEWTNHQYHPDMFMDEDDLIELSQALNRLVHKINERRKSE